MTLSTTKEQREWLKANILKVNRGDIMLLLIDLENLSNLAERFSMAQKYLNQTLGDVKYKTGYDLGRKDVAEKTLGILNGKNENL